MKHGFAWPCRVHGVPERAVVLLHVVVLCLAAPASVAEQDGLSRYRPDRELQNTAPRFPRGMRNEFPDRAEGPLTRAEFMRRQAERRRRFEQEMRAEDAAARERMAEIERDFEQRRERARDEMERRQRQIEEEIARSEALLEQRRKEDQAYLEKHFPERHEQQARPRYPYRYAPPGYPAAYGAFPPGYAPHPNVYAPGW